MTARLPPQPDEWIDRNRPIDFRFEGRAYRGFVGDTITTALAAAGVRVLGRSFKYHRPRGIYSLAGADVNAMFEDARQTNIRGDSTPLEPGLDLKAVNTFGGLARDWARFSDAFSRLMPVGFYYKAFFKPKRLFPFYERRLRRLAGLGAIDTRRRRTPVGAKFEFCDVLVIGAGPAGLAASIAAAECGARVILADEQPWPGGSLHYQWSGDAQAGKLKRQLLAQAGELPTLSLRTRTYAAGCYADHWVALVSPSGMCKVRAKSVVVATGCYEQPAVFANNDLPGIMLASAAQRLIHQYAVKPFERCAVLTCNAEGYHAALDLHRAEVRVEALLDLRPEPAGLPVVTAVREAGIPIHAGHTVVRAIAAAGKRGIRGVVGCPRDERRRDGKPREYLIECDGLAMSVGWAGADSLFYQAGGRMGWSAQLQQFIPRDAPPGLLAAGRLAGYYPLEEQIADGTKKGLAAAAHVGRYEGTLAAQAAPTGSPSDPFPIVADSSGKCFVDLDEDVHYKDIVNAAQEGFDQVELLKRYSTFGMGPSQGKLANLNVIRILARIKKQSVPETGVTRSRPFFHPVPLAHLAGRGFHPHRCTPLDSRHEALGAVFMPAGDWRRPAYYASAGAQPREQIASEVRAVRAAAGAIDVGTLGKLEVCGPDAALLLERIYTGRFAKMQPGTTRYALACDESGVIIDDGLVARLAADRFYVTTTTTASAAMYREMQRWAILWSLDVVLANMTGHRGAINLAGPRARAILRSLADFDLSAAAFPYLAVREGSVAGVPARCLRVGFVGEWGCEIHAPAEGVRRVWDAIFAEGAAQGIRPFGVEAQRILRLEKGHIIVSQDTDGLTTPWEADMAWAIKRDKPFFVGGRSLEIVARKPLERRLAGFVLREPPGDDLPKECHLVIDEDGIAGRITSVAFSPTLGATIGLAFVRPEVAEPGRQFDIRVDGGAIVSAEVVKLPFYDPEGLRQTEGDR